MKSKLPKSKLLAILLMLLLSIMMLMTACGCEYISGGYGDVHEDETTYFEFMDAIGSIASK